MIWRSSDCVLERKFRTLQESQVVLVQLCGPRSYYLASKCLSGRPSAANGRTPTKERESGIYKNKYLRSFS